MGGKKPACLRAGPPAVRGRDVRIKNQSRILASIEKKQFFI